MIPRDPADLGLRLTEAGHRLLLPKGSPAIGRSYGLRSDEGYVDAFVAEERERLGWGVAGGYEVRDLADGAEPEV